MASIAAPVPTVALLEGLLTAERLDTESVVSKDLVAISVAPRAKVTESVTAGSTDTEIIVVILSGEESLVFVASVAKSPIAAALEIK